MGIIRLKESKTIIKEIVKYEANPALGKTASVSIILSVVVLRLNSY